MRWTYLAALAMVTLLAPMASALSAPAEPPRPSWPEALNARIAPLAAWFEGELSLYVVDLEDGTRYAFDADEPTYLASAVKVTVMLEVLRQVDEGALSLDRLVTFEEEDIRDGMPVLASARPGQTFSVRDLLEFMVRFSDNAAADLLISEIGIENVNAGLDGRGVRFGPLLPLIEVRRLAYASLHPEGAMLTSGEIRTLGSARNTVTRAQTFSQMVERAPPYGLADIDRAFGALYAQGVNSASMQQMGELLSQIARCEGLTPKSCGLAHRLLHEVETGRARIRAGLPKDVAWAHKTGTQHRRACDVGFATFEEGRQVVIAACTRDFDSVRDAERLLSEIGAAVDAVLDDPAAQPE